MSRAVWGWLQRAVPDVSIRCRRSLQGDPFLAGRVASSVHLVERLEPKPPSPAHEVRLGLRAFDLAFPSENSVYDHSASAPFVLEHTPWQREDFFTVSTVEYTQSHDKFIRHTHQDAANVHVPDIGVMGFGGGNVEQSTVVICDERTEQFLLAHPLLLKSLYIEPHYSSIPIYIAESPGKGMGMFARRTIDEGECLFREPPLLVIMSQFLAHIASDFEWAASQMMPPRTLAALDGLHSCWPPSGSGARRWGILRTNAFGGVELPPTTHEAFCACFQLICRANHSCAPNVRFGWDFRTFEGSLTAVKPIEEGQEIFVNYNDVKAVGNPISKTERREVLQRKYHFQCKCERCEPSY